MTPHAFIATHATNAKFERGLHSYFEYRDFDIKTAKPSSPILNM